MSQFINIKYFLIAFCFLQFPFINLFAQTNSTGLEIAGSVDMLYDQGLNESSESEDKMQLRSVEILLMAPIDQNFQGNFSAAAHSEGEESLFEVHEAFVTNNTFIKNTSIKLGQYFLGLGRLNKFHQHDWPIISAPKVHQDFFADEAVFDTGIESETLLPTDSFMTLTLGMTNGRRWGHAHDDAEEKPKQATLYTRLGIFSEIETTTGRDLGFNYLNRKDGHGDETQLAGIDFTYKDKQGVITNNLFQAEIWYQNQKNHDEEIGEEVGLYLLYDFLIGNRLSFGNMIDSYKNLSMENVLTSKRMNNIYYGIQSFLTYHSSEFAKVRFGADHKFQQVEGDRTFEDNRVYFQLIYIIGSHPAHDF